MNNYYVLLFVTLHLNIVAAQQQQKPRIECLNGNYFHHGIKSGFRKSDINKVRGYVLNDTDHPITFVMQVRSFSIKPRETRELPKIMRASSEPGIYQFHFNANVNVPQHTAAIEQWIYPGIGDYVIVIKKDTSGITDLDLEVISKKDLEKINRAQEVLQKVGEAVFESGVKPTPVADIAAQYVGTDIEMPEEWYKK